MRLLDLTLATPAENLALDEALLLEAEAGRGDEVLRFWEWPHPAVVLGAGCRLAEDVDVSACEGDAVPILRRASGGGTVLLGTGCLLYTLILAYQRDPALGDLHASYALILDRVCRALGDAAPGLQREGISDLAVAGRKVSGNAQQRKRTHLLHHGSLLHAFAPDRVGRYLRLPRRRPDYRHDRPHEEFLTNLPLSGSELRRRLAGAWGADRPAPAVPHAEVRRLVREKYGQPDWVARRP